VDDIKEKLSSNSLNDTDRLELITRGNSQVTSELDVIDNTKIKSELKLGDIMKALEEIRKSTGSKNSNNLIGENV
jgi:hypothetical protein